MLYYCPDPCKRPPVVTRHIPAAALWIRSHGIPGDKKISRTQEEIQPTVTTATTTAGWWWWWRAYLVGCHVAIPTKPANTYSHEYANVLFRLRNPQFNCWKISHVRFIRVLMCNMFRILSPPPTTSPATLREVFRIGPLVHLCKKCEYGRVYRCLWITLLSHSGLGEDFSIPEGQSPA